MVVKKKPTSERIDIAVPKTQPDHIQTAVVEDRRTPVHSLMAYVSGMTWTVTYYKSVLGTGNNIRDLDIEESAAIQQYDKIEKLEIKVESALSHSYNQEKGTSAVEGSGLVYGFIIPNVSDYFVAKTDENDVALIRVTRVERKSHRNQSVWEIGYAVVGYKSSPDISVMIDNLEEKSVKKFIFDKERLVRGSMPVLRREEYELNLDFERSLDSLTNQYFSTFYNPTAGTLCLPSMRDTTYEHGLVDFVLSVSPSEQNELRARVNQPSHQNDPYILQPTIWTALKQRDPSIITYCNQRFGRVSTRAFSGNVYLRELFFSAIDYVMYPWQPDQSVLLKDVVAKEAVLDTIDPGVGFKGEINTSEEITMVIDGEARRLYPWILEDDFHVFTEKFYKEEGSLTLFESQVWKYLRCEALNKTILKNLIVNYQKLRRLDQFYFGPILMLLIRVAIDEEY